MSTAKIVELVVLAGCAIAAVVAIRTKKTFYAIAAVIIAVTILIDLAA